MVSTPTESVQAKPFTGPEPRLNMIAAEKMLIQGFHYPFPGLAHLEKAGDGYREVPAPWNPVL